MGMYPYLFKVLLLFLGATLALLAFLVMFQVPTVWMLNKLFGNEKDDRERRS